MKSISSSVGGGFSVSDAAILRSQGASFYGVHGGAGLEPKKEIDRAIAKAMDLIAEHDIAAVMTQREAYPGA